MTPETADFPRPSFRYLTSSPAAFIALGFGTGLSRAAPGTVGSLVGIALAVPFLTQNIGVKIAVLVLFFVAGIWACSRAGRDLGVTDHSAIVWDEVFGMALVALFIPQGPIWLAAGFVAFRFFDIVKPWPIRLADASIKNGFGVMFDDLLAAIYAAALLIVLQQAITYLR